MKEKKYTQFNHYKLINMRPTAERAMSARVSPSEPGGDPESSSRRPS